MKIEVGSWYYFDGEFYETQSNNEVILEYQNSVYEILRIHRSVPVFLEDHFSRFLNSFQKTSHGYFPEYSELLNIMERLIRMCSLPVGNMRVELFFTSKGNKLACHYVPHSYPSAELYEKGVHLVTYPIERKDPAIKQSSVNNMVREKVAALQKENNAFEVLLVNSEELVTEGSKSNIFFIKDSIVYTPPYEQVLSGITRMKVLEIMQQNKIKFIEESLQFNSINSFTSCFLTGTSPKILPVNSIGSVNFATNDPLLFQLMKLYDAFIEFYCRDLRSYIAQQRKTH